MERIVKNSSYSQESYDLAREAKELNISNPHGTRWDSVGLDEEESGVDPRVEKASLGTASTMTLPGRTLGPRRTENQPQRHKCASWQGSRLEPAASSALRASATQGPSSVPQRPTIGSWGSRLPSKDTQSSHRTL